MIYVLVLALALFSALSGVWAVGWMLLFLFVMDTIVILLAVSFGAIIDGYNLIVAVMFPAMFAVVVGQVVRYAILALRSLWLHNRP